MEKVLTATVLPRSRLGKRSPLGALVCNSSAEGLVDIGGHGDTDGVPVISGIGAGVHGVHRVKLHPGQRVYVHCGGQERAGAVEQHNHVDNEVSIFIQQLNQRVHRKLEDVWLSPSGVLAHPVSLSIDVPKRSVESADMDEIMAAMVLTSLSCSPMIQSPVHGEPAPVSNGTDSTGSEMSDGGYWSCDHGNSSPAPSPPDAEADRTPPVDDGLDMEMDQVLFDEPAPRKRKNSVKVAYRCLWPNCGKILTTIVGMKRHIRTLHLGRQSEQERCQREEDFYYTEIYQDAEQPAAPAGSGSPSSPSHQRSSPPTPEPLQPSPLSQSAPSSIWQVHSEHSYQAAPFRRRSVSVGEQWLQSHSAPSRPPHLASVSPPRSHCASRRVRGEAKKCRKVYGIEHRDQWCTACRWKKACQRFLD
ncbi:zinc finger protein 395a isoform X2 [Ictalurus punctatus]|uniref:Zinc finger protein 395a isoform X2 n=1 Tax=Ictalurus punctatus TaxID=7998 RepID=A0A2D0RMN2_ICTPU|nr:zinc finger protein 395a isoform X2 [Ictalurus punctatus]